MSEERKTPDDAPVPPPPELPDVESPPIEEVLDGVPSAQEIIDEQPSVDEILGRDEP